MKLTKLSNLKEFQKQNLKKFAGFVGDITNMETSYAAKEFF